MEVETTAPGAEGSATTTPESSASSTPSAPQGPIELSADQLVRLPGAKEPVKFGEWYRGFQSELTKQSQSRAALEKEVQKIRSEVQQRDQQGRQTTPSRREQMIASLRQKTYLSGEEAAGVVDNILNDFTQDLSVRDQALQLMARKLQTMDQALQGVTSQNTSSRLKSVLSNALQANGIPDDPAAADFAEIVWLAHEGDGLEQEFPNLLKEQFNKLAALVRKMDADKVAQAKRARVPGRGGQGTASEKLDVSKMTPKQTADHLWETMVKGD